MLINEKYLIGYIKNTHNLKGELIFNIEDSFINKIIETELVFIDIDNLPVPFFIEKIKPHNNLFIVKLHNIKTIEKASELIGCNISIDKTTLKNTDIKNTEELINLEVFDKNNNFIGLVNDYLNYDKNNLLVVKNKQGKEILIPLNSDFIKLVNNNRIVVDLPDGLIDLN